MEDLTGGTGYAGATFMFSEFQNTEGDCAGNTAAVAVTVMLSLIVTILRST
jgi:hypothetical protein